MNKSLNDLAKEIHQWAKSKGWWDDPIRHTIVGKLLLVHSEVSEAAEELRDTPMGHGPYCAEIDFEAPGIRTLSSDGNLKTYHSDRCINQGGCDEGCITMDKPIGFASEIADTIIRCLDLCARIGIDIDVVIEQKMAYNQKRPYQHGGRTF